MSRQPPIQLSPELELDRILSLQQAAQLNSLSAATLRRHYADQIIELSPSRLGMRLRDALLLSENE
jgi:hypothetical protein